MVIIGIDPGYAINGWAVFDIKNNEPKLIDYGVIETKIKDFYERVDDICKNLKKIIKKYNPQQASIETLFFNKNAKTAINVAQVRGAIASVFLELRIKIYDYTPLQVKQAIVGYGRAEKSQIQDMLKLLLNLKTIPKPDDAADAIAIGICHINSMKFNKLVKNNI